MGSSPETYNDPLVGVYRPVLLIQTQKCHFAHPFSDLAPKTLCHHYLDKKSNKKIYFLKAISNSHVSLSFLLIWN